MSITFQPYVYDATNNSYVFPNGAREVDADGYSRFELNLCNANAYDLLIALGLEPESCGTERIDDFARLVTDATRRHLDQISPSVPTTVDAAPGRMTMIFIGRRAGYVESKLGDLARLIADARTVGATHIGWG